MVEASQLACGISPEILNYDCNVRELSGMHANTDLAEIKSLHCYHTSFSVSEKTVLHSSEHPELNLNISCIQPSVLSTQGDGTDSADDKSNNQPSEVTKSKEVENINVINNETGLCMEPDRFISDFREQTLESSKSTVSNNQPAIHYESVLESDRQENRSLFLDHEFSGNTIIKSHPEQAFSPQTILNLASEPEEISDHEVNISSAFCKQLDLHDITNLTLEQSCEHLDVDPSCIVPLAKAVFDNQRIIEENYRNEKDETILKRSDVLAMLENTVTTKAEEICHAMIIDNAETVIEGQARNILKLSPQMESSEYVAEILNESQENLCIKTVEDESNLLFSHRKRENNSQEVLEDCSDVTDQVNNLLCQSKLKKICYHFDFPRSHSYWLSLKEKKQKFAV